jgi:hypothetical protein
MNHGTVWKSVTGMGRTHDALRQTWAGHLQELEHTKVEDISEETQVKNAENLEGMEAQVRE